MVRDKKENLKQGCSLLLSVSRFLPSEDAAVYVILLLSDSPCSAYFLVLLLYLQQKGRSSANPRLSGPHVTNSPNNLTSVSFSLYLSHARTHTHTHTHTHIHTHTQTVQNLLFFQYSFRIYNSTNYSQY